MIGIAVLLVAAYIVGIVIWETFFPPRNILHDEDENDNLY